MRREALKTECMYVKQHVFDGVHSQLDLACEVLAGRYYFVKGKDFDMRYADGDERTMRELFGACISSSGDRYRNGRAATRIACRKLLFL